MRISDWSSDVCSSDETLGNRVPRQALPERPLLLPARKPRAAVHLPPRARLGTHREIASDRYVRRFQARGQLPDADPALAAHPLGHLPLPTPRPALAASTVPAHLTFPPVNTP